MSIVLKDVYKRYDNAKLDVVVDFNLEIIDKEFLVLVGPSGCGKSTVLRMIAGLEKITKGSLLFDGRLMNDVLPGDRNIGMVFQSYALYPHMNVYQNMEYPLKIKKVPSSEDPTVMRKMSKEERDTKIKEVAEMLGLTPYLDRKPKNLSGGQRQRVALGRELVRNVDIFLMDEPLSNLDAKLRVMMRAEITKLHQKVQKTIIYVTHDQVEAMTMATRIVIMKDGVIQQIGTPTEVYNNPSNMFVAGFIGTPAMNFIKGSSNALGQFRAQNLTLQLPKDKLDILKRNNKIDKEVVLGIRPEDITMLIVPSDSEEQQRVSRVKIEIAELLGFEYNLIFNVGVTPVISRTKATRHVFSEQDVDLHFDLSHAHFFDTETEATF